jgi:adenylate cyclase
MSASAIASTPLILTPLAAGPSRRTLAIQRAAITGCIGALLAVAIAIWWMWPSGNSPTVAVQAPASASPGTLPAITGAQAPRLSFVVLPFENLSTDADQEYFVDGITDGLTTDLSRISGSFVIARNTAFTYRGKPTDVKQIGRELGVRYVIEGSVRRSGDQVQANVQLIDAETGAHLWADRFDTDRTNLTEAQSEITTRLARTLNVELVREVGRRIEQEKVVDPDARDLVTRGWALFFRPISVANSQEAQRAFERALEIDPKSADARSGIISPACQYRAADGFCATESITRGATASRGAAARRSPRTRSEPIADAQCIGSSAPDPEPTA